MITNILIIVAMSTEANFLIKQLNLKDAGFIQKPFIVHLYKGKIGNKNVSLLVNEADNLNQTEKVGSQPAVLSTTLGIMKLHPDLIINAGTAGGNTEMSSFTNDIYVSKEVNFISRRLPANYKEYGIGHYQSYPIEQNSLNKLGIKVGMICSSDSFDGQEDDVLAKQLGCHVRDMEAAGIAWVASTVHIPIIAVKGITDNTSDPNGFSEFIKNFNPVMQNLSIKLKKLILSL